MTTEAVSVRWAAAQDALAAVVRQVTTMMRGISDSTATAVGCWNVGEVAMHLTQAWVVVPGLARGDLSRFHAVVPELTGSAGDALIRDLWDLDVVTRLAVGADPERDLGVLADRIEERAAEFLAEQAGRRSDEIRPWLVEGVGVPRSALTCHLLNETIIHGHDIARAAGVPWRIERAHAAMVFSGFVVEVVRALDPRALVDQVQASGVQATFDLRLRGGDRFTFVFDDGRWTIEAPSGRPIDCHLAADPAELLLVVWGRRSQWSAIGRGRLFAWGRRPWLGPRLRRLIRNP